MAAGITLGHFDASNLLHLLPFLLLLCLYSFYVCIMSGHYLPDQLSQVTTRSHPLSIQSVPFVTHSL